MPKNDNAHALRLSAALQRIACEADAAAFAGLHPLSRSASVPQKAKWAREVCQALEDTYGEDTARDIRRSCRCGDGKTMADEIRRCMSKTASLQEGCLLFSKQNPYAYLQYVSEHEVIFGYHACVCSCVKRSPDPMPLLWCECSAGYAEAMFAQVFGEGVQVTLLESVKAGGDRCKMHIQW